MVHPSVGENYLWPVITENTIKPEEAEDDAHLREALKRCSVSTYLAAREFRKTRSFDHLPTIVHGVIERSVDRELRGKMRMPSAELRLAEDLGLDSLSLMEVVMLAEDILRITIDNEELRQLRTLGDVTRFMERKVALVS
ncbi:MAG: phosphopantetheine-binding protein [Opitutaceae bacterium]